MNVLSVNKTRVVGPSLSRRVVLLSAAGTVSAVAAYWFPDVVLWKHAALVVFGISFLAGFSALWSP